VVITDTLKVLGKTEVHNDFLAWGDVSDNIGTMEEMRTTYNFHAHPTTGATTGTPNKQM